MRTVQEIFTLVIEEGFYHKGGFMCHTLADSARDGIISQEEQEQAQQAINQYMKQMGCIDSDYPLFNTLCDNCREDGYRLPDWESVDEVVLKVYGDWENRPLTTESILSLYRYYGGRAEVMGPDNRWVFEKA